MYIKPVFSHYSTELILGCSDSLLPVHHTDMWMYSCTDRNIYNNMHSHWGMCPLLQVPLQCVNLLLKVQAGEIDRKPRALKMHRYRSIMATNATMQEERTEKFHSRDKSVNNAVP